MTDLQKQIEELEKAKNQYFELGMEARFEICRKALSIIKQLQEELEKQKDDYEALSKDFVVLEEEINELKGENNDK